MSYLIYNKFLLPLKFFVKRELKKRFTKKTLKIFIEYIEIFLKINLSYPINTSERESAQNKKIRKRIKSVSFRKLSDTHIHTYSNMY